MATTLPIGTVSTFFNNSFINTDPYYVKNLDLWRHVLVPPTDGDLTGFLGLLPVVVKPIAADQSVKISFDITDLPATTAALTNKSLLTTSLSVLEGKSPGFKVIAPASMSVKTILPVKNVRQGSVAVLFFDITELQYTEVLGHGGNYVNTGFQKYKVTIKDYNNSNGVNIDSVPPMVDQVIGSTATFSFDITTLPSV